MTDDMRSRSALLDDGQRQAFLNESEGWSIEGEVLSKTFTHASFAAAVGFVAAVGVIAEKAFHHPDIDIRYSNVTISLTTHDAGGLTSNDTELARAIDTLR
ncbi:MAG TPA: 4a-hydroxytetrahydrobiopterin dehydratase [Acidimicrobiia bacterium]|jgi:4a-hydroxytetrahydrobiopterin dehydratase